MMQSPDYSDLAKIKSVKQKTQEEQKNIINSDIASIDNAIESGSEEQMKTVHMLIEGKYSVCIPNIGQSMYGYFEKIGFSYEMLDKESMIHNLSLMKAKLQGYLYDFTSKSAVTIPQNSINVNVPITNEINISITFEQAKQKIEDMPGLTDAETEDIKTKIDELENISKESISKKKKWEKVKPILLFALDKGADVAITIMGLIMQMKLGM